MTGPIRGEKSLFLLWEELSLPIVCNVALLLVMDLGGHAPMKNLQTTETSVSPLLGQFSSRMR